MTDMRCWYKDTWTDAVGTIPVCQTHGNNSKHTEEAGPHRPCITVDPWVPDDFKPGGLGSVLTRVVEDRGNDEPKPAKPLDDDPRSGYIVDSVEWHEFHRANSKAFEDETNQAQNILRENRMPCGYDCLTPAVCPRVGKCGLTGRSLRRKYIDMMPWAGIWPWSPRCKARKRPEPGGYFGRCELKPHDSSVEHALERGMEWVRWSDGPVRITPPDYISKWVAE